MTTITSLTGTDGVTAANSMTKINANFTNLNSDKIETSVLDTDTALTANSDSNVATQKAVKAYVDAGGNVNASETSKGIVEEATDAEVTAGTATGATGAKLFVTPAKLATFAPAKSADVQSFTTSGTYTKPSGTLKKIFVQLWGGGGGGGFGASSRGGCGGSGGSYVERWFEAATVGATETVTLGDGGAAKTSAGAGNDGVNSTFGSLMTAYGGKGGGADGGVGGVGAGQMPSGAPVVGGSGTSASPPTGTVGQSSLGGGGGGGSYANAGGAGQAGGLSAFGGGGGGGAGNTGGNGGNSLYAGAGGGGGGSTGASTGGTSIFGGNGGAGAFDSTVAGSGIQPAGGGGGSEAGNSGAGGKGKCIVTTFY